MSRFLTTNLGKQTGAYSQCSKTTYEGVASKLSVSEQGVTRLDGARGKKQVWRPPCSNVRPFGSKVTVFKEVLVTLLGLFGARGIVTSPRYAPVPRSLVSS